MPQHGSWYALVPWGILPYVSADLTPAMKGSLWQSVIRSYHALSPSPEHWQSLKGSLSPGVRAIVERRWAATDWVPVSEARELRDRAVDILFDGQVERMFDVGAETFRRDNRVVHRVAFRILSVDTILTLANASFPKNYKNHGSYRTAIEGRELFARYRDTPNANDAYWHSCRGYISAFLAALLRTPVEVRRADTGSDTSGADFVATLPAR